MLYDVMAHMLCNVELSHELKVLNELKRSRVNNYCYMRLCWTVCVFKMEHSCVQQWHYYIWTVSRAYEV